VLLLPETVSHFDRRARSRLTLLAEWSGQVRARGPIADIDFVRKDRCANRPVMASFSATI
jgi:hypothetical protein